MNSVDGAVRGWLEQDRVVALATVLKTWGSAPRKAGAKMAITGHGEMAGSVSGGCVEGAVVERALNVLSENRPVVLEYGVTDETAWDVGLACGGQIEILVEPLPRNHYDLLSGALRDQAPAASLVISSGPTGMLGRRLSLRLDDHAPDVSDFDEDIAEKLRPLVREGAAWSSPRSSEVQVGGSVLEAFIEPVPLKPELIMIGGVHIAVALADLAKVIGYATTVIDPRRSFGSPERFTHADRLIQAWPQDALAELGIGAQCAIAVLTHDPKIDDPALLIALRSPAFYVGALGSTRTQKKRRSRLKEAGLSDGELDRLHGPIGLDIGAQDPQEIALSIMAEIVAARRQTE